MEKKYIIGGLAVIGAIALIAWYRKPKRNSEGFYSADGRRVSLSSSSTQRKGCAWCRDSEGGVYHTDSSRSCDSGDRCITQYA